MTAPAGRRNLRSVSEIEQAGFDSANGKRLDPALAQRLVQIAAPAMAAQDPGEPLDAA